MVQGKNFLDLFFLKYTPNILRKFIQQKVTRQLAKYLVRIIWALAINLTLLLSKKMQLLGSWEINMVTIT